MNHARFFRILLPVLMVSAAVWVAMATGSGVEAATATASGSYALTFHVAAPSTVPDGSTLTCSATIAPQLSTFDRLVARPAPAHSVQGVGKLVGSSGNCTVQVPFAFAVRNPANGAALSYRIDAFTRQGPAFQRTQQGITLAYPQPGTTASVGLNVSL
jgi:hypothetical protein